MVYGTMIKLHAGISSPQTGVNESPEDPGFSSHNSHTPTLQTGISWFFKQNESDVLAYQENHSHRLIPSGTYRNHPISKAKPDQQTQKLPPADTPW